MKTDKVVSFSEFILDYKLSKIARKMTDIQLIGLYLEHSPVFFDSSTQFRDRILSATIIYMIGTELKRRHPDKKRLQEWDLETHANLLELIK